MSYNASNLTPLVPSGSMFIAAYSPKVPVSIVFPEDSPYTDQSFAAECDINTIMARYQSTGEMPVLNNAQGQFLDVVGMDFQAHMDAINDARDLFGQLPSKLRDRFDNDPGGFLDFAADPQNLPELASLGLLTPEATERIASKKSSQNASGSD